MLRTRFGHWVEPHRPLSEDVQVGRGRPAWTSGSGEVEPIEIHDLVPRGDEVGHELLLRVVAGIDLRECTQLGVRTEDEVSAATGPLELAGGEVSALEGLRI